MSYGTCSRRRGTKRDEKQVGGFRPVKEKKGRKEGGKQSSTKRRKIRRFRIFAPKKKLGNSTFPNSGKKKKKGETGETAGEEVQVTKSRKKRGRKV